MKIGKKIIAGAMLSCGAAFSFSAVQAQTCVVPPSCEELGYSMSVTDCDGQRYIRCPLDVANDNAVYCARACSCPVGSSPYNTCTRYARSVKGECDNTCYQCWDGSFQVSLRFFCRYDNSGAFLPMRPQVDSDWICLIEGLVAPVKITPLFPHYTEEELRAFCPGGFQPDYAIRIKGYCNVDGSASVPWPGK